VISFDTNGLVYATGSISDVKVMRAFIARAMRAASSVLLLQTLADFSNVAIRKARIAVKDIRRTIDAWRGVCEPYSRSMARQYFLPPPLDYRSEVFTVPSVRGEL